MITERDIQILLALFHYYLLSRAQIQRLLFRNDTDGRITRRRLQLLVDLHLINRTQMQVCRHAAGAPAPVYYLSRKGCEVLAEYLNSERYLLGCTETPLPHHILHWLSISDRHITVDESLGNQDEVQLLEWNNEWDIVNKDEAAPEKHYRLYTLIRQVPRLVCAPDAGFLLQRNDTRKVFYLEEDQNTSGVYQVANQKTPGYAAMVEKQLHRRHFPTTTVDSFDIVVVAPNERRRDALRKAVSKKPGAELWRFVAAPELTAETFLHGKIFYPCDGDPGSLLQPPEDEK